MPGIYPALLLYNDENLTMCVYSGMDTTQASEACTMGSNPIRRVKRILPAVSFFYCLIFPCGLTEIVV